MHARARTEIERLVITNLEDDAVLGEKVNRRRVCLVAVAKPGIRVSPVVNDLGSIEGDGSG